MELFSALAGLASGIGGLFGANKDAKFQREAQERNIKEQKRFAKRGLEWRAADAVRAGRKHKLHPLALLGAQTHSFSPVQVGSTNFQSAFSNMGQDIAGAVTAMSPTARNQRKQDQAMAGLALERAKLENTLIKTRIASQIRTMLQPGRGPGVRTGAAQTGTDRDWDFGLEGPMIEDNPMYGPLRVPGHDSPDFDEAFTNALMSGRGIQFLRELRARNLDPLWSSDYRQHLRRIKPWKQKYPGRWDGPWPPPRKSRNVYIIEGEY